MLLVVVAEKIIRQLLPLLVFAPVHAQAVSVLFPRWPVRGLLKLTKSFLFSCGAGAGDAVDVEPSHDGVVAPWLLALAGAAGTSGS